MSNHKFSITLSSKDQEELDSIKEVYRWYHGYLPPMATLFNAKLGDGGGVSFSADDEPMPETMAEALLTPAERAAMHELIAQSDEAAEGAEDSLTEATANHPVFSDEAVSFAAGGDPYDSLTGVPMQERPETFPYLFQRFAFQTSNGKVTKHFEANKPKLNQPEDYQVLYDAYYKDSKRALRFGEKAMGFEPDARLYHSDEMFGWQRVAGTNPRVLMCLNTPRLANLHAKMGLTDAHLQAVAGKDATLAAEAHAARLYYCDYHLLNDLPLQQGRFMYPAIGVFWSDVRTGELRPVAIQLGQTLDGRIHVPTDPDWASARAMFQVSDFNYHEMGTHLSEAHFTQEAFAVAARRNLAPNHPIGALTREIYWALLFNNALGRQQLVNPGGYTEKMMAGELIEGSIEIVKKFFTDVWRWDDWNLDLYLERQGTNNAAGLPVYPYRDDGVPLWREVQRFATEYVNAWYERDAVVANDRQIESFVAELNSEEGGNLRALEKGFPETVTTKAELSELIARLMWQAGPGHAGINYSQFQYFAAVANSPGSGYADCHPREGESLPSLMAVLPPIEQAINQSDILNVITQKVFGRLGTYPSSFLDGLDTSAHTAVTNFQAALGRLAGEIDQRNRTGPREAHKYVWLHPNNLPNSTNI